MTTRNSIRNSACLALMLCSIAECSTRTYKGVTDLQNTYMGVFSYCDNGRLKVEIKRFEVSGCEYLVASADRQKCLGNPSLMMLRHWTASQARDYNSDNALCYETNQEPPGADPLLIWDIPIMGAQAKEIFSAEQTTTNIKSPKPLIQPGDWIQVRPGVGSFWAVQLINCPVNATTGQSPTITYEIAISEWNENNGQRSYMGCGDTPLLWLKPIFVVAYAILTGIWIHQIKTNRQHTHRIHILMLILLVLKVLTIIFANFKLFRFAKTGHGSGWDIPYFILYGLKGMLLFLVILLLGTGWSFLKAFLQDRDRKILMVVLPLQVIANIAYIVIDENPEGSVAWRSWRNVLKVFDIICCCAVLLPIVWSIRHLREAAYTDGKVARNLARVRQFRTFYILVVVYIYFTRIVVVIIEGALKHNMTWVNWFISEVCTFGFYTFTGWRFRPVEENPYLVVEADDLEEALTERQELELKEAEENYIAKGGKHKEDVSEVLSSQANLARKNQQTSSDNQKD